jgi:hypothetical protein
MVLMTLFRYIYLYSQGSIFEIQVLYSAHKRLENILILKLK